MKYLKLFSCVFLVEGYHNDLIYDIQRQDLYRFDKGYRNLFYNLSNGMVYETIPKRYLDVIKYIEKNELAFTSEEPELFSEIQINTFVGNSSISNLILDVSLKNFKLFTSKLKFIHFLDSLNIDAVLLYIKEINDLQILDLIACFNKTTIRTIEIALNHAQYNEDLIAKVIEKESRIKRIYLYGNKKYEVNKVFNDCFIVFLNQNWNEYKNRISQEKAFLTLNSKFFFEAFKCNPYFNKKMYIGFNGEIKNAPECLQEFGNIENIESAKELEEIVALPDFQKYWHVRPDMIDVTKDSEYRYMELDNRIPHQRADGSWYYKQEENYNPYISKWKGEAGYKTLEDCGIICNDSGFSIDYNKLGAINKHLWGE